MEIEDLRVVINDIEKSYITNFEYKDSQIRIKITKPLYSSEQHREAAVSESACSRYCSSMYEFKSEYVGIIKLLNPKDNRPFITPEQKVNSGDLLCIIEQLKINIEVRADVSGYIKEICIEDNTIVDYMKRLFVIELE